MLWQACTSWSQVWGWGKKYNNTVTLKRGQVLFRQGVARCSPCLPSASFVLSFASVLSFYASSSSGAPHLLGVQAHASATVEWNRMADLYIVESGRAWPGAHLALLLPLSFSLSLPFFLSAHRLPLILHTVLGHRRMLLPQWRGGGIRSSTCGGVPVLRREKEEYCEGSQKACCDTMRRSVPCMA